MTSVPRIREIISRVKLDPMELCYYRLFSHRNWRRASYLAAEVARASSGAKTKYFSRHAGTVGKAGEMIFESFLQDTCELGWDPLYDIIQSSGGDDCDFLIEGMKIDVKTRTLRVADPEAKYGYYDRSIHINRFPMIVSEEDAAKRQDVYVCCGYNIESREGYVLGWATHEEVVAAEMDYTLRYPSKCIALGDLHPTHYLLGYIASSTGVELGEHSTYSNANS
jgi:hypothetical protein